MRVTSEMQQGNNAVSIAFTCLSKSQTLFLSFKKALFISGVKGITSDTGIQRVTSRSE